MSRQLTSGVLGRKKTLANEYRMFVLSQGGVVNDISWVEQRYAEAIQAGDIQSDGTPNFDYAMFDYRAGLEVDEAFGLDRVSKIWGLFKINGVYPVMGTDELAQRGILTNDGIWFDDTRTAHKFIYEIPKNYGKNSFDIECDFNLPNSVSPFRFNRSENVLNSGFFPLYLSDTDNRMRDFISNNSDSFINTNIGNVLPSGRSHKMKWTITRTNNDANIQQSIGNVNYKNIDITGFDTIFDTDSILYIGRFLAASSNADHRIRMISLKYPKI